MSGDGHARMASIMIVAIMNCPPLPRSFFVRDCVAVARELLGKQLRHGEVVLRITETEAYCWYESGSHCHRGRTKRNAPMWETGGRAYVYLCYGLHQMLNLTTDVEGNGAAVLIRACEPVRGLDTIQARRGDKRGPVLLTGPGKVGAALALDTSWSGHDLCQPGGLEVLDGPAPAAMLSGPRVGIDYALPEDIARRWRFAVADTPWVSQRKTLSRPSQEDSDPDRAPAG